ncbi:MAG: four helix bundle protein [bacterium]
MRDFRTVNSWHKAHALTIKVYKITKDFPREELYGITSQLRRACSSIPTNIAEGCGRETEAELCRFSYIAMGSASETECLFILTKDLKYISDTQYRELSNDIVEIKKIITGYIQKLKTKR